MDDYSNIWGRGILSGGIDELQAVTSNPNIFRQGIGARQTPRPQVDPFTLGAGLFGLLPGVGDAFGLAADVHQYATDPSSRTPLNYGLTAAGLLPILPNMASMTKKTAKPDYAISHRPNSDGPRAFNLLENDLAPRDIYTHPQYYVGEPGASSVRETVSALRAAQGNPEAIVTIYRASPKGQLNAGDWVSLSKDYAKRHGMADNPSNDVPVHAFRVKAKDIRWAGDDLHEFGYFPEKK